MLEREYKELMTQVSPCAALREQTAARMVAAERKKSAVPHARSAKRLITVALACVLVLTLSVTALASAFPGFREWLFGKGSPVAEVLQPVSASTEENGISMEVLGAMGDKNNVIAYFTLQDTEGENRLSADMDVVAVAVLNGEYPETENVLEGGMNRRTYVLEYDRETQTALCRFEMTTGSYWLPGSENVMSSEPYDATDAEIELRVRQILSGESIFSYLPLQLSEMDMTTEVLPVSRVYHNTGSLTVEEAEAADAETRAQLAERGQTMIGEPVFTHYRGENGDPVVLKPGTPVSMEGADFAEITAVGFVDGKLHLQYRCRSAQTGLGNDLIRIVCADAGEGEAAARQLAEHGPETVLGMEAGNQLSYKLLSAGPFFEIDQNGEVLWGLSDSQAKSWYQEMVFDIAPEELERYEFFATGSRTHTETLRLSVAFDLRESLAESTAFFGPVAGEDISLRAIDITPLGVYLTGPVDELSKLESLEFLCGEEVYSYRVIHTPLEFFLEEHGTEAVVKLIVNGAAVEPQKVTAVRINGEEIPLQ